MIPQFWSKYFVRDSLDKIFYPYSTQSLCNSSFLTFSITSNYFANIKQTIKQIGRAKVRNLMFFCKHYFPVLSYSKTILFRVGIYLFKINIKNTKKQRKICPKLTKKDNRTTSIDMITQLFDLTLVSFFLTLNIFYFLLLWTRKCKLGIPLILADNHTIFEYCIDNFFCV